MAVGDKALYSIIAPPEATVDDVKKMTVEIYLNEEDPPEHVTAEPLGRDPQGNSAWVVTVTEGPEKPQEAPGAGEGTQPGPDTLFGKGGP